MFILAPIPEADCADLAAEPSNWRVRWPGSVYLFKALSLDSEYA